MSKRGPKPRPQVLRDLDGNPEKRPRQTGGVKAAGAPVVPEWLDDDAKEVWRMVLLALPPCFYSQADTLALAAYCKACSLLKESSEHVDKMGLLVNGPHGGLTKNPAASVLAEQQSRIASLGTRLGLDVASRQSLSGAISEKNEVSRFEGLICLNGGQKR